MNDLNKRVAALSPAKRALFERRSREPKPPAPQRAAISRRCPRQGAIPLSFAQERLWFLDRLEPGNVVFSIPNWMRLRGNLDVPALERALNEIVRRHEIVRSTYTERDGRPFQVVQPFAPFDLPVADLASLPQRQREEEAARLCAEDARRPFDLTRDLMLRASLYRLAGDDHILFLNRHHIASDGWSLGVLKKELESLYRAFAAGEPSPLPELPIQYADFTLWQRDWMNGERIENLLAFWRDQLADAPALLELPTDRPRPPVQSYRGATLGWDFSESLSAALSELGRSEGATLFMVLLAAFQVLLHRYTGSDQVVVGSVAACRNRTETESLLGFFANTLVLHGDLSGDPSFREFLRRTREVCTAAFAHQDLPFETLVNDLRPARDAGYSPLFQVMFVLQMAQTEVSLPGLRVTASTRIDNGGAQFDLTLSIEEREHALRADIEYNTDLFDHSTIRRMLGHYQTLLAGVAADSARPLAQLPLLCEAERQKMLLEWNGARRDFPEDALLHKLFEAQVERTPGAVAVVFENECLSYAELNRRANQLARRLQKLGVARDVAAGICMERSLEMVVAILAVLKAGGAYVPLDPSYPPERLALTIADAGMPVILTQSRFAELCGGGPCLVCADTEDRGGEDAANLAADIGADSLAYVIYTSGSTGKPKGVMIPHRAICNHMLWMQGEFPLDERDRVLQKTSISFDASVWEFFAPLFAGAQLVMAQPEGHRDSSYLAEAVARYGITTLQLVPSMLRVLVEEPKLTACAASLRRLFCGGEALAPELCERFFARLGGCELINLYGPSECAIDTTFHRCAPGAEVVPIGRPVANTRLYILDAESRLAPIGVAGQLHVGGAQLARGYWRNPQLTAEKFIPDPFDDTPGARMYRSGDLARYLPDGNIEFLGRLDHQVKIHGFRIELSEIETALRGHPAVADAVVTAYERAPGDKMLAAYFIPRQVVAARELREYLGTKLPNYMVPAAFVVLDAFPLTGSGKIDRRALPEPGNLRPDLQDDFVAPQTPLEQAVAAIWLDLLRIERVGIHDNFFELGGHSLLLTQVHARLRKILNRDLPIVDLFQYPTVAALAHHLNHAADGPARVPKVADRAQLQREAQKRQRDQIQRQGNPRKQNHV